MTASRTMRSVVHSTFLGDICEEPASELYLPAGLPGFETERSFLPIEIPAQRPLVFLQSTASADVCFVCLPISSIDKTCQPSVPEDERLILEFDSLRELIPGEDILSLALLTPDGVSVRTNLDAPIVINLRNYRCAQILQDTRFGVRRLNENGLWETPC